MQEDQLYNFFETIIDDSLEKKIIKMLFQGYDEDTVIKKLLESEQKSNNNIIEGKNDNV